MENSLFSLKNKIKFLFFAFSLLLIQTSNSQCVTGDDIQDFCAIDNNRVSDLVVNSGINVVWFNALTGGDQYPPSTPLINGNSYYALDIDSSCTDPTRFQVTVNIYGKTPTDVNVFVGKCASEKPTIGDLSATASGTIEWYDAQTGGTLLSSSTLLIHEKTYWVQQIENGCTSIRLPTTVNLIDPPSPTISLTQSFCSSLNPTVGDLQAVESNVIWYESDTSTTPLDLSTLLIHGEEYWASLNTFPCESTIRAQTTVQIDIAPNAGTDGSYSECEINLVKTDLYSLLGSADAGGVWTGPSTLSGGYLGTFEPGINTEGTYTYTVSSSLSICPEQTAAVQVSIITIPPPTIANSSQSFCEIDNPTVADLSAVGTSILWYDTQISTTPLNTTDALINGEDYWASQTDATEGCESATRLAVAATIISTLPPTTSETTQTFCEIDNSTVADLSATGISVLWYDTQISTTPLSTTDAIINGEDYWATQTDAAEGCESATRLTVTASIISTQPPTTSETTQTFCEIDNPTVEDLNAIGNSILWYESETATTPLNTADALIDGEDYWASQTDAVEGCQSVSRLMVTATIISTQPPTTSETTQTFCEIDNPTVTDLNATGNSILWYESETATTPIDTADALIDGEDYWASQTDAAEGCQSVSRLMVTATIISTQPPTTSETTQTFCEIDNPTVTDLNATGNSILWYESETATTPLDTADALIDGEDYWASQTDAAEGCQSLSRLMVTATIISTQPPTTSETSQGFCEIDNPTVADLNATGSGVLWYADENSTTPLDTTEALIDGEDYWASQTDIVESCESASRLMITVTIFIELPPTTSETNQSFCEIDSPTVADLNATGNSILWYADENSTTSLDTAEALIDGEDYWATQTDGTEGCESATRLVVTATIIAPQPPTTAETTQTFCEIDNPTVADLNATGNSVLWYADENSTTPLDTAGALINGEDYWATQTDASGACESAIRLVITATIIAPQPPTTAETTQSFCEIDNPTVANLNATGNAMLWYADENSITPLDIAETLIDGENYWATQKDAAEGCESVSRLMVTAVIISTQPPITSETNQSFCKIDNPTVADLNATGNSILWYADENATTPLDTAEALIDSEDYWASQADAAEGCESVLRLMVTVTILDELPPTTSEITQSFCEIDNPTIANLNASGNAILWYDAEDSTTPLNDSDALVDGEDYWATQTGSSGCESDSKLVVTVSIISIPPPTTTETNQVFCINDYLPAVPTIADIDVAGTNVLWYISESSTTALNGTDILINGQMYWASQTDTTSGCESKSRLAVTANLIDPPVASAPDTNQTFCLATTPTITNINVSGDTIIWFDTETSTTPLSANETLVDGEDYWALNTDTVTGCESNARLVISVSIVDVAPPTITETTQTFCTSDDPTVGNLNASGNVYWYTSETETTPLDINELLVDGNAYWAASNDIGGCVSSTRVQVTVILTDPGTPVLTSLGNEFCKINNPTLEDLNNNVAPQSNGAITWYDTYPNGSALSLSEFLNEGETYYAIETDNDGCSSVTPLEVTVTLEACDEYDITIYDGFSPNGDGINDTFTIENLRILYPEFKIEFFNRWGNLMYTSDANSPDWNGRLNGNDDLAPSGVYFFIINFNKDNRKPLQDRLYLSN